MYCTKCGGEIPEGAMFCTYCGQPVQGQKMQPAMRSVNNGYVAKKPKIRIPAVPQDPAEAELPPAAAQEPPAHIRVPRTAGKRSLQFRSPHRDRCNAKQFLGNPYVYGGTSLTNGADCSGFTMRIFEHFGVTTGRTSRDQAANGKEISLDQIQPGDLLFYASGKTINHVALYIGDGKIIHASTSKTGIIISTAYYRTPAKAVTFLD